MRFPYQVLTFAYGAVLFCLMTVPPPFEKPERLAALPIVAHVVLFAGMAALVALGIRRSHERVPPIVLFAVPVAASALYGLFLEVVQIGVPLRSFDWKDVGWDAAGAVGVQVVLCRLVWKIRFRALLTW